MSILSWFKEVTSGNASAELMQQSLEFKDGEQDFHGLNMRDALDAHTAWTKRLEGKIEGSNNEELDIAKVASDCECVLGKWIHGEAKKQFGESPIWRSCARFTPISISRPARSSTTSPTVIMKMPVRT